MIGDTEIKLLSRHQLDTARWDHCIDESSNGLIYAYSFYLDQMSAGWDALVLGDYEAVMPLTHNRKFGFSYLYQPFLAAQLGIFSKKTSDVLVNNFLNAIPPRFRYIDINLNFGNTLPRDFQGGYTRKNFVLPLYRSYRELQSQYSTNINRNIRKAAGAECTFGEIDPDQVISLSIQQMKSREKEVAKNISSFRKLSLLLQQKKMVKAYGVKSKEGVLLASCIFFFSHGRAYYLLVGNHPSGRDAGASHFLIDGFIREHAASPLTLDFEGSDIPGLAQFYAGFGAREENYPAIRINRLPFWAKWLKK